MRQSGTCADFRLAGQPTPEILANGPRVIRPSAGRLWAGGGSSPPRIESDEPPPVSQNVLFAHLVNGVDRWPSAWNAS
jgi:hypothetical protein